MDKKYHGLSITSLVLGISSLVFGFIPIIGWAIMVLAIVFGFISLSKIKHNESLKGKGLAIAGIILGFVSLVYILIITIFFLGIVIKDPGVGEILSLNKQCEKLVISPVSCDASTGEVIAEVSGSRFTGEITSILTLNDGTKKYSTLKTDSILEKGSRVTINSESTITSKNPAQSAELSYLACGDAGCVACQSSREKIGCN